MQIHFQFQQSLKTAASTEANTSVQIEIPYQVPNNT